MSSARQIITRLVRLPGRRSAAHAGVLRLGVVVAGRLVAERVVADARAVTVGRDRGATLAAPCATVTVFERDGSRWLRRDDATAPAPLAVGARGKIALGPAAVLFQVLPPPTRRAARVGGALAPILALSFVLQGGSGVGADLWWRETGRYQESPFRERDRGAYDVLAAEVARSRATPPPKPAPAPERVAPPAATAPTALEAERERVASAPERAAARRARAARRRRTGRSTAERVVARTFLRALTSDAGDAVAALSGDATAGRVARAFDGIEAGTGVAMAGADRLSLGPAPAPAPADGRPYKTLDARDAPGRVIAPAVRPTRGKRERTPVIAVRTGPVSAPVGVGESDPAAVAAVFRRRLGAVRHCYDVGLRSTPDLGGKVKVRFTISPAGRVTDIDVAANSTGDARVASCIVGKVRTWRFPPPRGGSVTYSHSFLLEKR